MPVIDTPSIWDYIANAGQQAVGSYQQAKEKVQQDAMQNAGLLSQLFGAGAIGSEPLQTGLSKVPGVGSVKVQPSKAEKASTPGTPEFAAEQAQQTTNEATTRKNQIVAKWSQGTPITEEEATIAGLPTAQDVAQMKAAKADPLLDQAGKQYVDAAILKKGGRLMPHDAMDIAANAYQQYIRDYQAAGLGTLNAGQLKNAQRYFASRAMDRLNEQRRLDIEATAAQNRDRSAVTPADRMFQQLTNLQESNRKTLDDFLKIPANAAIPIMADKPDAEVPAAFKGAVARYRRLQQRESDLQNAQSQLALGVIPKGFASLLASNVGGAPTPTAAQPDPLAQIKADFKAGKLTRKQIQDSKMITPQQKDEILGGNIKLK